MTQIHPYLTFRGNCREAMTFYQRCLGGELTLQTVGESPIANQWPAAMQEHILHGNLSKGPLMLLASEVGVPEDTGKTANVSLSINCDTLEELKTCFSNLSEGAEVTRPLHSFFNGTIGALTDQFGISWIFYSEAVI